MGRYAHWSAQDVAAKADWEGGVEALLDWGGADAFEGLGEEAYRLARDIRSDLHRLQDILNDVDMEGYEGDDE